MWSKRGVYCLLVGLLFPGPSRGEEVRFDSPAEWATWDIRWTSSSLPTTAR